MKALSRLLIIKIVLTTLIWCIPLLLFPSSLLKLLGFPVPEPQMFLRLLGMAYAALVLGYGFALRDTLRNQYPQTIIWVGVVSNGGACLLLAMAALTQTWGGWGPIAQAIMWGSLVGTAAISLGLIWFGLANKPNV